MKTRFITLLFSTALLFPGVPARAAAPESPAPTTAALYKAGNGIQLSAGARELAGLKTVDVAERVVDAKSRGIAIPTAALLRTVKGDFVYVANGPWFLRTPVTAGVSDGGWIQVTDGLYEGDTVVSHGVRLLWLAELQAVNGGVGCADGH